MFLFDLGQKDVEILLDSVDLASVDRPVVVVSYVLGSFSLREHFVGLKTLPDDVTEAAILQLLYGQLLGEMALILLHLVLDLLLLFFDESSLLDVESHECLQLQVFAVSFGVFG